MSFKSPRLPAIPILKQISLHLLYIPWGKRSSKVSLGQFQVYLAKSACIICVSVMAFIHRLQIVQSETFEELSNANLHKLIATALMNATCFILLQSRFRYDVPSSESMKQGEREKCGCCNVSKCHWEQTQDSWMEIFHVETKKHSLTFCGCLWKKPQYLEPTEKCDVSIKAIIIYFHPSLVSLAVIQYINYPLRRDKWKAANIVSSSPSCFLTTHNLMIWCQTLKEWSLMMQETSWLGYTIRKLNILRRHIFCPKQIRSVIFAPNWRCFQAIALMTLFHELVEMPTLKMVIMQCVILLCHAYPCHEFWKVSLLLVC